MQVMSYPGRSHTPVGFRIHGSGQAEHSVGTLITAGEHNRARVGERERKNESESERERDSEGKKNK